MLQQGCSRRRKKERILKRENRLYKQGQTRSKEGAKSTYFIRKAATARLWFCLGRRAPQHQKGRGAARSIRTACPTLLDLSTVLTPFHRVRQKRWERRQKGKKYERPPEHGAAAPRPRLPKETKGDPKLRAYFAIKSRLYPTNLIGHLEKLFARAPPFVALGKMLI